MALNPAQLVQVPGFHRIVDASLGSNIGGGVNQAGELLVNMEGRAATYSGGIVNYTPQATPQDFFTLTGSAAVVARLLLVEVWIGATAAAAMELQLVYNSVANTGGTAAVPVAVPHDPADAAASCALAAYSVASTPGTTLGVIAAGRTEGPILAGAGTSNPLVWAFNSNGLKPPILRTAAQQIALNGNGAALPSGIKFSIRFTWSEEALTGN